ncbi:MAG: tetratricopeptide repeat protein [Gemmatimonadetes bacterium]|nr:tetratricopeptide repeat protein [Gemmatimonadota bacterium]
MIRLRYFILTLWILLSVGQADASLRQVFDAFIAGHYEKAEAHLQTLLKTSSDKDQIHFLLGRLAAWDGRTDDAFDHFEKAAKFSPQNADYYWWLAQMYGQKAIKASIFRKPGHARNTKKSLEKAIALDPDHIDARLRLMGYHLSAPGILGGKKEEAQNQADQIKMRDPIRGHLAQAQIYRRKDELDKAEQELRSALEKDPSNDLPVLELGRHLSRTERREEAVDLLDSYVQQYPFSSQAFSSLSAYLRSLRQFDRAYRAAEQRLKITTDSLSVRRDTTVSSFKKIVIFQRDKWRALYVLGRISAESGDRLDRGLEYLKACLQIIPPGAKRSRGDAYNLMGQIYLHQDEIQRAREAFQTALKWNSKQESAREALEKLDKEKK